MQGWDEIYASHSLHEITMYYPMRVLRERRFKLIYNLAYELPFPQSLDLHEAYTWQKAVQINRGLFGKRRINTYLHRPQFELYDLLNDPDEVHNLSTDPAYKKEFVRMKEKLKQFQKRTLDLWLSKWTYE